LLGRTECVSRRSCCLQSQHCKTDFVSFFLSAFEKCRKANISFVMSLGLSVRPSVHLRLSVRVEQFDFHYTDFH
jgi:hypothetical protein